MPDRVVTAETHTKKPVPDGEDRLAARGVDGHAGDEGTARARTREVRPAEPLLVERDRLRRVGLGIDEPDRLVEGGGRNHRVDRAGGGGCDQPLAEIDLPQQGGCSLEAASRNADVHHRDLALTGVQLGKRQIELLKAIDGDDAESSRSAGVDVARAVTARTTLALLPHHGIEEAVAACRGSCVDLAVARSSAVPPESTPEPAVPVHVEDEPGATERRARVQIRLEVLSLAKANRLYCGTFGDGHLRRSFLQPFDLNGGPRGKPLIAPNDEVAAVRARGGSPPPVGIPDEDD